MRRFNEVRWAVATLLARWSVNPLYRLFKALLGLSLLIGLVLGCYTSGQKDGAKEMLDLFMHLCYDNGGMLIDGTGRAIQCTPLTQIVLDNS